MNAPRPPRPRLPHAPVHAAHTLTNIVHLPWTAAPAASTHHNPDDHKHAYGTPAAFPHAPLSATSTPAPSSTTPILGDPGSTTPKQSSRASSRPDIYVEFAWQKYELKQGQEDSNECASSSSSSSSSSQREGISTSQHQRIAEIRNLLHQCAYLEARLPRQDDKVPQQSNLFSTSRHQSLFAGHYLEDRLMHTFEWPSPSERHQSSASGLTASAVTNSTGSSRKRRRTADIKDARRGSSSKETTSQQRTEGTIQTNSSGSNHAYSSAGLPALWIFQAVIMSSSLRRADGKDFKGKGKERAYDDRIPNGFDFEDSDDAAQEIAGLRNLISTRLALNFDLKLSGQLNPRSLSLYPHLALESLSNPAMLQPQRKYRLPHSLLQRALQERLTMDFIAGRAWDNRLIPPDKVPKDTKRDEDTTNVTATAAMKQEVKLEEVPSEVKEMELSPRTLERMRSATLLSSSEEGEVSDGEDGEIQEDEEEKPATHAVENGVETDQDLANGNAQTETRPDAWKRGPVRAPTLPKGLGPSPTFPIRFGSLVLMLPRHGLEPDSGPSSPWLSSPTQQSVLCIRFRVNAGPEALAVNILPSYAWLTCLAGQVRCDRALPIADGDEEAQAEHGNDSSGEQSQVRAGDRVWMAPMGFGSPAQERKWLRACMPGPRGVFPDQDKANSTLPDQHTAEFVGELPQHLNELISKQDESVGHTPSDDLASPDKEQGESDNHTRTDRTSGWWLPDSLRTKLSANGVDIDMLGTIPRWAVLRMPKQQAVKADVPSTEDGEAVSLAGSDPRSSAEGQAEVLKKMDDGPGPLATLTEDQDVAHDVQSRYGEGAFLWPLGLCFVLPAWMSPKPKSEASAKAKLQSDKVLPFEEVRGQPIYLPPKQLTTVNITEILAKASGLAKYQQDGHSSDLSFGQRTPMLDPPSNPPHAILADECNDADAQAAHLSSGRPEAQIDRSFGLPKKRVPPVSNVYAARFDTAQTQLAGMAQNANLMNGSQAMVPRPAQVMSSSNDDDIWNNVLGVMGSEGFETNTNESNPAVGHSAPGQTQTTTLGTSNAHPLPNGRRDMDAFDAMDLVTEDDFSFFDNVADFDFGALDAASVSMDHNPLTLADPTAVPFLNAVTMMSNPGVGMGEVLGNGSAIPVPTDSDMMMLNNGGVVTSSMPDLSMAGPVSLDTGPSQMGTDHPSMPGFTPSSLTADSSPAFGLNGQNSGKTPRTPFSPTGDVVDQTVSIHPGSGFLSIKQQQQLSDLHAGQPSAQYSDLQRHSQLDGSEFAARDLLSYLKSGDRHEKPDPKQMQDKYESGKFAIQEITLPSPAPAPKAILPVADVEAKHVVAAPRTPTTQRSRFITRRGLSKTLLQLTPTKRDTFAKGSVWTKSGQIGTRGPLLARIQDLNRGTDEGSESGTMDLMSDSDSDSVSSKDSQLDDPDTISRTRAQMRINHLLLKAEELMEASAFQMFGGRQIAEEAEYSVEDGKVGASGSSRKSTAEEDSENQEIWRRTVLESLVLNAPLRAQALAQQCDSLTLPVVPWHESAALLERLAAALVGSSTDLSALLLMGLISPPPFSFRPEPTILDLTNAFGSSGSLPADSEGGVDALEPPYIMTGCQGYVTRIAPSALRFWDKLGLSAVGGPKHVAPFVLQLDVSDHLNSSAVKWLERIDSLFKTYGLGSHTPNHHSILRLSDGTAIEIAEVLGVMAMDTAQQERWEETMVSIFDTLKAHASESSHLVVYVVGDPAWPMRWQGLARMREDLEGICRQRLGSQGWHLHVRGVPQMLIFEGGAAPLGAGGRNSFDLRRFAFSVYDSLQRAVARTTAQAKPTLARASSSAWNPSGPELELVQYHAFTLAPLYQRHMLEISLEWPLTSRDVVDRGLLLHVGYELRAARGLVVLSMMDQRGQASLLDAWKAKDSLTEDLLLIWLKAVQFARRASVAWRYVICKSTPMNLEEVLAWSALDRLGVLRGPGIIDVTLACVDTDTPLNVLPTQDAPSGYATGGAPLPGSILFDSSNFSYALYPSYRLTLPAPIFPSRYANQQQQQQQQQQHQQSASSQQSVHNHKQSSSTQRYQARPTTEDEQQQPGELLALTSSATIRIPRHTDYSTGSTGTFSTQVFSVPAHKKAQHVLWLHILQVYSRFSQHQQHHLHHHHHHHHHTGQAFSSSADGSGSVRSGRDTGSGGGSGNLHLSKHGGVGGVAAVGGGMSGAGGGVGSEAGLLDPFLSSLYGGRGSSSAASSSSSRKRSQFSKGAATRHGSPLPGGGGGGGVAAANQSLSSGAEYGSVGSSHVFPGSPSAGHMFSATTPSIGTTGAHAAAAAAAAAASANAAARASLGWRVRDITQSMHELQLLSSERYCLSEPASLLPAHLALLHVAAPALASYGPMKASSSSSSSTSSSSS
ncbi:hypothetical protein OC846_005377 [Tilletia horrida]|uniref:Mediator of RNA polymerase II transcription subunit 13 n=1 Tax=Tilletia horrida TaxID=155126 RepID=A0AAN6GKK8_9BASI|nr:hypothetical protein OC846_005377 [Tilletia horrida]KAK0547779.1 hypothetical protein OC845_003918 [Tilletia horrida]KAK0566926.1 hypothetical protein OC861_002969 [Tilletia horrida]